MYKLGIDANIPLDGDRTRFLHSRPPAYREYSGGLETRTQKRSTEEIKRSIVGENKSLFFYEISSLLPDESFRNILLAWSRLREIGEIEQGMDGRYALSKQK